MGLYNHNLGILGKMAKGETEYNADDAQAAANNILALTGMSHVGYWPAGSDNGALGDVTRAKPELWQNFPDVIEKAGAVRAAAEGLAAVAGNGQEGLGAAVGALGGACTECHKAYRTPAN
jgi:cytochrome c556